MTHGNLLSRVIFTAALTLLLALQSGGYARSHDRLGISAVISILRHQGFSSPTDSGTTLTYVGQIREKTAFFSIYYYDHVNIHPVQVAHGIQALIILKNDVTYVGHYSLESDDPIPRISGTDILFELPATVGNKIHFDANGPPASAWVNGMVPTLDR